MPTPQVGAGVANVADERNSVKDPREAELAALFGHQLANYHIICSTRFHYVYVGLPKVASSTVRRILIWLELDGELGRVPDDIWDWAHMPIPQFSRSGVTIQEAFFGGKYVVFAFVRNPYTRILSCFLDKVESSSHSRQLRLRKLGLDPDAPVSFNRFLACVREKPFSDAHWAPQKHLLKPGRINYDIIARFEAFDDAIITIIRRIQPLSVIPLNDLTFNAHATGASSKMEEFMGVEEKKLIDEIYDEDFTAFGYSRDPHFVTS
jgi:hypothetical protein